MRLPPVALLFFALAAPAVTGCASADEEPAPSRPAVAEPISYDASEETKSDLGVVVWGSSGDANGMRAVGYDAHGNKAITFEQRVVFVDAQHHYFETTVAGGPGSFRARIDGTVGEPDASGRANIDLFATESTIATSPWAGSVLEHLQKDFDAGEAKGTSLVGTQSVHTLAGSGQQLVQQPSCLSQAWRCGVSLWRLAAPLLPCASVAATTSMVVGCGLLGSAGGPAGIAAAAGTCAAPVANTTAVNAARCAIGAEQTYNGWSQTSSDISNSCGSAASRCTGGGGAATSSFTALP